MTKYSVSTNSPDGTEIGTSATEKVAFHGATPVAQAAVITLATGATIATVVTAVQSILTALKNKGLVASS